jgi:hypothetical protein
MFTPILESMPCVAHLKLDKQLPKNKTFIVGSPAPLPLKLI